MSTEKTINDIVKLINENKTKKQIADKLNITIYKLNKICKENNITFNSKNNHGYTFNKKQLDFIRKLYEDGVSASTISSIIFINIDVILRLIKQNNWTNKKTYNIPLGQCGRNYFHKNNILLTNKEKNDLYIKICNEIMDEKDSLNFKTNIYNKSQKAMEITEIELNYLKQNYKIKALKEIAKDLNRTINFVERHVYKNRLFWYVSYKREVKPEDKENLIKDIKNPHLSAMYIANKYNLSHSCINRLRKEIAGENFKYVYDYTTDMTTLEYNMAKLLNDSDILYKTEYKINDMRVDFLLSHKVIIEVNGEYWHKNTKERDIKKYSKLIELGYHIIAIDEVYFNNNSVLEDIISFYEGSLHEEIHECNSVNAMCGVNKYDILYLFANGEGYTKITGIDNVRAKLLKEGEGVETIETK